MSISDTLKQAIENRGESLYRIAKDAEVDYSALHRFYNGERDIRLETADKLAEYFGLELRTKVKPRKRKK